MDPEYQGPKGRHQGQAASLFRFRPAGGSNGLRSLPLQVTATAAAQLLAGALQRGLHGPTGILTQPGRSAGQSMSAKTVSDPLLSCVKTSNSSKQQLQLIESLLPPVPNFPINSSSSPLPLPEQRLLRALRAPALAVSEESGAEQVAVRRRPGHPFYSAPTLRHTGFLYSRTASAAPLLHHPTPFPNPPLRPSAPNTHAHTRLACP